MHIRRLPSILAPPPRFQPISLKRNPGGKGTMFGKQFKQALIRNSEQRLLWTNTLFFRLYYRDLLKQQMRSAVFSEDYPDIVDAY